MTLAELKVYFGELDSKMCKFSTLRDYVENEIGFKGGKL
jgi:hypothetical protein